MFYLEDLPKGIWTEVEGYGEHYLISKDGLVFSIKHEKLAKPYDYTEKGGQVRILLTKNWKTDSIQLSRLVAKHFVPNPNNYKYVLHKDGDKTNNAAANLYWSNSKRNDKNISKRKSALVMRGECYVIH